MEETTVRELMDRLADETPSATSVSSYRAVDLASGVRRRRQQWTIAGAAALVVLVLLAAVTATAAVQRRPDSVAANPTRPTAPTSFSPGQQWLSDYWLPADYHWASHSIGKNLEALSAYSSKSGPGIEIYLAPTGKQVPKTSTHGVTSTKTKAGPRVNGVPSRWYPSHYVNGADGGYLKWDWAPGAQAAVEVQGGTHPEKVAAKIAAKLRLVASTPLLAPFSIVAPTGLPLQDSSVSHFRDKTHPNGTYQVTLDFAGSWGVREPTPGPTVSVIFLPLWPAAVSFTGRDRLAGKPADLIENDHIIAVRLKPTKDAVVEVKAMDLPARLGQATVTSQAALKHLAIAVASSFRLSGDPLKPSTWVETPIR